MTKKIGLFVGTFDPVHEGHEGFVRSAIHQIGLNEVIVVPEAAPRYKADITDIDFRKRMLKKVFDTSDVKVKTLSTPYASYPETYEELGISGKIYLLMGSDVAFTLKAWPGLARLLAQTILVVGVRDKQDMKRLHVLMEHLEISTKNYELVVTPHEARSSSKSRRTSEFHPKIRDYIQKHHLYKV